MNEPFELEVVSIRLVKDAPLFSNEKLVNPHMVVSALWKHLREFDREVMCVINLKCDMTPINVNFASVGTIDRALVSPRDLFKSSILSNASHMMLLHNHPSGSPNPSAKDIAVTEKMETLCEMMGITLVDHVIVSADREEYFSFATNNMIKALKKTDEEIDNIDKLVASINERSGR